MKINNVNSVRNNFFLRNSDISSSNSVQKQLQPANKSNYATLPASVYQANFAPSFGKYRRVKDVFLMNKDTEMNVRASLMKDTVGDSVFYKVMVGREEAGYLDLDCDSVFPEDDFLCDEPDNNIPQVRHIRSLLVDRFSGIGTELINAAVNESIIRGKGGSLWLKAEKGFARTLSNYRKDENPIPFYYKLGFKSLDPELDEQIRKNIAANNINALPEQALLILPSEDLNKFKSYYSNHFKFVEKIA